jgi:lipopolysaccharide/colanic/teichoic acid biosynthesis glycosyltransferase
MLSAPFVEQQKKKNVMYRFCGLNGTLIQCYKFRNFMNLHNKNHRVYN